MSAFAGYLFASITTNTSGETVITPFPASYIKAESWSSLPNSREEIKAYRDDNTRDLTRVTADGHKSSFSFKTRRIHLDEKIEIQKFFTDAEVDTKERKLQLRYWNDEENIYKDAYFYRADITFSIYKISDDDILYNETEISLIEY